MTNERIALGKGPGLERLPRGSTARHAERTSAEETYKLARYAKQFVVDEQDIIDDRLNALMEMPTEMGEAAARLRPDLVYALLLANAALGADSIALFHASSHGANKITTALAAAALKAGITAMAKQTDNSVNLNLRPRFLIVPHDLWFTAAEILKPAGVMAKGNTDVTMIPTYNSLGDEDITIIRDNRIGAAGVTDPATQTAYTGSAAYWFLSAGPRRTLVVGYRSGTGRRPQVRSFILNQGQWGIGWDISHDIGTKALDFRGLFWSTGAG